MASRIKHHNLLVSNLLDEFVKTEMLNGLNITPDHFWKSLSIIVNKFTPENKNLLAERKSQISQLSMLQKNQLIVFLLLILYLVKFLKLQL